MGLKLKTPVLPNAPLPSPAFPHKGGGSRPSLPVQRRTPAPYLSREIVFALALVTASATAHADGDAARGEKLYVECIACHSLEPGVQGVGPSLHGVFNRKAGELADYRYSPALKRSGIIWTAETLDAFVADSLAFLPANRMPYAGLPDARDRADLIAYLAKATK